MLQFKLFINARLKVFFKKKDWQIVNSKITKDLYIKNLFLLSYWGSQVKDQAQPIHQTKHPRTKQGVRTELSQRRKNIQIKEAERARQRAQHRRLMQSFITAKRRTKIFQCERNNSSSVRWNRRLNPPVWYKKGLRSSDRRHSRPAIPATQTHIGPPTPPSTWPGVSNSARMSDYNEDIAFTYCHRIYYGFIPPTSVCNEMLGNMIDGRLDILIDRADHMIQDHLKAESRSLRRIRFLQRHLLKVEKIVQKAIDEGRFNVPPSEKLQDQLERAGRAVAEVQKEIDQGQEFMETNRRTLRRWSFRERVLTHAKNALVNEARYREQMRQASNDDDAVSSTVEQ